MATTVIEVGVDVPNASLMIIENPERLGLAQLHQLRGRVGRGTIASHCVLMYQTPLSQTGRARLKVLKDSQDGFFIAEQDLLLRGPGELLGTRQTGLMAFRVAELPLHEYLLDEAFRTNSVRVTLRSLKIDGQITGITFISGCVLKDSSFFVYIVDYHIQVAIIIQISVCRSIREPGRFISPYF